jgi:hypothetical protein
MRWKAVALIAAALAAVSVELWVRSHWVREDLSTKVGGCHLSATSYLGGVHFLAIREYPYARALTYRSNRFQKENAITGDRARWHDQYPAPMGKARFAGFGYASGFYNLNPEDNGLPRMPYIAVVLPYWILISLLVLPLVLLGIRSAQTAREARQAGRPTARDGPGILNRPCRGS